MQSFLISPKPAELFSRDTKTLRKPSLTTLKFTKYLLGVRVRSPHGTAVPEHQVFYSSGCQEGTRIPCMVESYKGLSTGGGGGSCRKNPDQILEFLLLYTCPLPAAFWVEPT